VVGHGWVEWDVCKKCVRSVESSAGLAGRFKKAEVEVEVGDVRRGSREDVYDDETSWPDLDYIDLL
jgi:hypothetical protein